MKYSIKKKNVLSKFNLECLRVDYLTVYGVAKSGLNFRTIVFKFFMFVLHFIHSSSWPFLTVACIYEVSLSCFGKKKFNNFFGVFFIQSDTSISFHYFFFFFIKDTSKFLNLRKHFFRFFFSTFFFSLVIFYPFPLRILFRILIVNFSLFLFIFFFLSSAWFIFFHRFVGIFWGSWVSFLVFLIY